MATRFRLDYKGLGELLASPEMQREMERRAEKVAAVARATAPDADPQGVGYKFEFEVSSGVKTSSKGTTRAYGRVTNHSDHATAVEYGMRNVPKHRTLGKALRAAGD